MNRVNEILKHPRFVSELKRVDELERDRKYCKHGMDHLLDTARIAHILNPLEDKEVVYAAALLHDIGRARQYEDGTPHEQEGSNLSAIILPECGFSDVETGLIQTAILLHRGRNNKGFAGLLYRADKLSRRCFDCPAQDDCDWDKKNMRLEI